MRGRFALLVLTLGFIGSGCIVVKDGGHSASVAESTEEARERTRNRQWAEAAWQKICVAQPQRAASPDYAQGFKDGFTEHLCSGQEQPPRSAPARYRAITYQSPQGYRAIEDWFDGYRHGIAAAIESGYRRWVTGPSVQSAYDRPVMQRKIINPEPSNHRDPLDSETPPLPMRMPNKTVRPPESVNPEIRFGLPKSVDPPVAELKVMLLPPIGVDREGDPSPRAVVPPPTLGGPQPPGPDADARPME
jgi:hypothetical protein